MNAGILLLLFCAAATYLARRRSIRSLVALWISALAFSLIVFATSSARGPAREAVVPHLLTFLALGAATLGLPFAAAALTAAWLAARAGGAPRVAAHFALTALATLLALPVALVASIGLELVLPW